ncbi:MAG: hypothetical protein GOU97_00285 [Nanoarchaeota archaeon]|nr:hypothetical protein [Nanoarchaeota archaeon]
MILLLSLLIALLCSLILTRASISYLRTIGLENSDVHKPAGSAKVVEGGLGAVWAFFAGIMIYVGLITFQEGGQVLSIFAPVCTIIMVSWIGFIDDIKKIKKWKGGLKQWQKPLLTLLAVIPLMAVRAGSTSMSIPFIGIVDFGLLYTFILIPIGVVGASNAINMLEGFNGLQGMGVIVLVFQGVYAYWHGQTLAAAIAFCFAAALLGFLKFNWRPAKIFPGDTLTYAVGAAIASVAIVGNIEKFSIYLLAPWILEFFLKLRTRFKAECFGKLQKDGTLKAPEKVGSLTHLVMRSGRWTEKQVTIILIFIELLVGLIALGVTSWQILQW